MKGRDKLLGVPSRLGESDHASFPASASTYEPTSDTSQLRHFQDC